jgi:hypothetical protein
LTRKPDSAANGDFREIRIECDRIAEIWAVADDLGRLQRLGVITDEDLQSVAPLATPSA